MVASRQLELLVDNVDGDSVKMHKVLAEPQFHFCLNTSSQLETEWMLTCWNLQRRKLQRSLVIQNFQDSCKERCETNYEKTVA